jgi:DNA-binding beta-propeller fold protein YncE
MKSPSDIEGDRIVLTEAGSEMEGKVAGISFAETKKSGGSHGQELVKEGGKKYLVAGTLAGNVYKIELDKNGRAAKKEGPFKVGEKFCGAIAGTDGNIYFEDMTNGSVYTWNPEKLQVVDKMPVGMAVCGIQWTKNNEKAYISDMPAGIVYVYDWKTKKKIKDIKSPEMTFIHQIRMTPDGKNLWVSAPNEFEGNPEGKSGTASVLKGGTKAHQVVIIDTKTDTIVKRIVLPANLSPHDFAFTKNGYVLLSSRSYGSDDSLLAVMNMKNDTIVEEISLCASCHNPAGVKVAMDAGSPLLCGITVDWKK